MKQIITGNGNNQLLYFTSSSLTDDSIIYISDESGAPNLFCGNLHTGHVKQLTKQNAGFLKSYVYFDGIPYTGFGKASPSLDHKNRLVYYIEGMKIRRVSLEGEEETLALLPENQMTGFTHVSADGRFLCVPTVDAAAFDGFIMGISPSLYIDNKVKAENLSSYIRVYDTKNGKEVICEQVPGCWITHVQFSPLDNKQILYNHEWCSDCGIRRMWMFDGNAHRPLREENTEEKRSRKDWTCHEMWQADGKYIIYHGTYTGGGAYIGRVRPDGSETIEIPLPEHYRSYGHFTAGRKHNDWLVSDGYYRENPEGEAKSEWISLQITDWDNRTIRWIPLVKHGSSWRSQDEHPHPIFAPDDKCVYFTSDISGKREIYSVKINN